MPLQHLGFIDLPPHAGAGGFDHAAVHEPTGRVYVAHTANDAVDVIDVEAQRWVGSIGGLKAVAGALVVDPGLVITSNRGENSVGIIQIERDHVEKVAVGVRPNGLAYDPGRHRLLAAHVGDPAVPGSCTVSIVDVRSRKRVADLPVAGRTRWTVYDPVADAFHVNIAAPAQIVVVGPVIRCARSGWCRFPRPVHTGWTSTPTDGVCSVRVMPACCSKCMPTRATSSSASRSPGFPTWCSSTSGFNDSTSRSETPE